MDNSSLTFTSCAELREEFNKCPNDVNKRILIIDVRDAALYERSHLCLDGRNNIESIRRKMRVMNIDPDLLNPCYSKVIPGILSDDDKRVFMKRRDATDVVIIDQNTDDVSKMAEPRSKVMQLINALTKYDNQPDQKIIVPIKILRGGFREWQMKYPHFTTDPTFDPDTEYRFTTKINSIPSAPENGVDGIPSMDLSTTIEVSSPPFIPKRPPSQPKPAMPDPRPAVAGPGLIIPPKPAKNAPGTAMPVIPSQLLKPALPRSHSSPNVAQADGDELENSSNELDKLTLSKAKEDYENFPPSASSTTTKPRVNRALKPPNSEAIKRLRARLDFGRKPEASTGKAITGLQNLGNTCFMNSVIQCLAYQPALVSYICSYHYFEDINFNTQYGTGGELVIEFGALVEELNLHRYRYIEPKSFRESVTKHVGFAGNEQQDSHEFMMMLFDKLHHDLNKNAKDQCRQNGAMKQNGISNNGESNNINVPRATLGCQFWKRHLEMNKSIISDMFEGIFMSTLTCTVCLGQSNTFEVFNCLSLPIPSETRCHLRECLSHFSNPERIEAAWECPRCKQKREADKKIVICRLPKILIIHLKRFSLDGRWRQKLQTNVDFPLNDLKVDCTNVLPESDGQIRMNATYNLCAVVNHFGHLDGGHYTAFCKLGNRRWYTFDDGNVTDIEETDVCSPAAYILFYSAGS